MADEIVRQVYEAIPNGGATIAVLCHITGLGLFDVLRALTLLCKLGWVELAGKRKFYTTTAERGALLSPTITRDLGNLGK